MPFVTYKNRGETPLFALQRMKAKDKSLQSQTISYAGRLDPLAEGLLLVLVGEENQNRRHYEKFEKTYEFDVLLGIQTDSYDMLGIPQRNMHIIPEDFQDKIFSYAKAHVGQYLQEYPPYSSKPVQGKPLYYWARNNKLQEISIPSKEIAIASFTVQQFSSLPVQELTHIVQHAIESVTGDFRQSEIREAWVDYFRDPHLESFSLITCEIMFTMLPMLPRRLPFWVARQPDRWRQTQEAYCRRVLPGRFLNPCWQWLLGFL